MLTTWFHTHFLITAKFLHMVNSQSQVNPFFLILEFHTCSIRNEDNFSASVETFAENPQNSPSRHGNRIIFEGLGICLFAYFFRCLS